MLRLVLMQGIPGSGKSTLAREMAAEQGLVVCSTDDRHYEDGKYVFKPERAAEFHEQTQIWARFLLSRGVSVIIDNTNITNRAVAPYYQMAQEFGAMVQVVRCAGGYGNIHSVPSETVQKMRESMELLSREKALEYLLPATADTYHESTK